MTYGTAVTVDRPHAAVVEQVRAALSEQGLGILVRLTGKPELEPVAAEAKSRLAAAPAEVEKG